MQFDLLSTPIVWCVWYSKEKLYMVSVIPPKSGLFLCALFTCSFHFIHQSFYLFRLIFLECILPASSPYCMGFFFVVVVVLLRIIGWWEKEYLPQRIIPKAKNSGQLSYKEKKDVFLIFYVFEPADLKWKLNIAWYH